MSHHKDMDVDQYFSEMPEDRRIKAQTVHSLILDLYPHAQISLKYKMPTYESEKGWFAIGNQKNYWSIYTCSTEKIEDYLVKHPEAKHGKGCINFRKKDDVDLQAMKLVIQKAMSG